jgi:hypothetical protein
MKSFGHKRVAYFISNKFSLSEEEKESLLKGSIEPDYWLSDRLLKRPHHRGRIDEIEKWVLKAREEFLKGNKKQSAYNLGIALHFIGDYTIPSATTRIRYRYGRGAGLKTYHARQRAKKRHKTFEEEMSEAKVGKIELFTFKTPLEIVSTIKRMLVKQFSPAKSLSRVYQVSYAVSEIVWRDSDRLSPEESELLKKIPSLKKKYFLKLGSIICSILSLILMFSIPAFSIFFLGSLYLFFIFRNFSNPDWLKKWYEKNSE